MVVKLYGHPLATSGQRIQVILEELSVPYELITLSLKDQQHKTPEYLAHQPFGQLPYMDDDGSSCSRRARDVPKTARFEQAASVELSNFEAPVSQLAWEVRYKPMRGLTTIPEEALAYKTKLEGRIDAYDVMLSKTKFLAGDELTMVDLFHLPHGSFLEEQGFDFVSGESSRWPNVARWWKEISARPSWKKVVGSS
uniref:glutathione transferase n=1 Tax=Ganoderma boninense TaxID=34458 RepID=A0A5K1K2I3_9APHY|nr:Dual O-methyltransferase/FAD-dependent monooxygenase CTB3 (Cercosporin toxin biosynthesis cluster protein 3) [Includes: O-methyltransferase (EC, FAD-dependent monooxygenase (EC ] [Ganoderma boninense]